MAKKKKSVKKEAPIEVPKEEPEGKEIAEVVEKEEKKEKKLRPLEKELLELRDLQAGLRVPSQYGPLLKKCILKGNEILTKNAHYEREIRNYVGEASVERVDLKPFEEEIVKLKAELALALEPTDELKDLQTKVETLEGSVDKFAQANKDLSADNQFIANQNKVEQAKRENEKKVSEKSRLKMKNDLKSANNKASILEAEKSELELKITALEEEIEELSDG